MLESAISPAMDDKEYAMKVILTQELKGKGGEGDVVEVARGYAVNYLIPRKLAVEATPGNLKQLEARMGNIRKREETRLAEAGTFADRLNGKSVTITAKVGESGRLYGSITSHKITDAIAEQLATDVDRRKIDVHGHIKELGAHAVSVQIYRDVKAEVVVNVVAEGEPVETGPTVAELLAEEDAKMEAEASTDGEIETEEPAAEGSEAASEDSTYDEATKG